MKNFRSSAKVLAVMVSLASISPAAIGEASDGSASAAREAKAKTITVDCDRGGSLNEALRKQDKPLEILFHGLCEEFVVIDRDDVTILGSGESSQVKGKVTVDGAARVTLRNFLIRDTPPPKNLFFRDGDGLRVVSSRKVTIDGMIVQDTGGRGISIEESSADVIDTTIRRAVSIGIIASASQVNLFGTIESHDSRATGICVTFAGNLLVQPGAVIKANNNPVGFFVEQNSVATLTLDTQLSVAGNHFAGILVVGQGAMVFADATITVSDNPGLGVVVGQNANFIPFSGTRPKLSVTGNGLGGVQVFFGGIAQLPAGTEITDNRGPGLFVDSSIARITGSRITGNQGGDVLAAFGAQLNFGAGNELGSAVVCDETVLSRGPGGCQAAVGSAAQSLRGVVEEVQAWLFREPRGF